MSRRPHWVIVCCAHKTCRWDSGKQESYKEAMKQLEEHINSNPHSDFANAVLF